MRVNLTTQRFDQYGPNSGTIPLSLTIRPACGLPGDYIYPTDSAALMLLLRRQTDLPDDVLQRFAASLLTPAGGQLKGVELSDNVLSQIGYFID